MTPDELLDRCDRLAVEALRLSAQTPRRIETSHLLEQVTRSAPSVSAHYRSARRSRSLKEFVARMGLAAEEADESDHWMRLLAQVGDPVKTEWADLRDHARELRAILASSYRTAKRRLQAESDVAPSRKIRDPQ